MGWVSTDLRVSKESRPWIGQDSLEGLDDILSLRMIWCNPISNQAVWKGLLLEDIHQDRLVIL